MITFSSLNVDYSNQLVEKFYNGMEKTKLNENLKHITEEYKADLLVRMTHHSTAIEGNTLTQAETISILLHNYIPRDMSEREYYEVKNYRKAFNYLLETDRELTTDIIKKYNKHIMENLRDDNGEFKKTQNIILGSDFETTKPYLVPTVIEDWCQNLKYRLDNAKTKEDKVEVILDQHIKFEKIHPFGDGNGRTGRLLIIHSCLKEGIEPIIIPKEEKGKYIHILATEDIKQFKKWGLELQEKEKERMLKFLNKKVVNYNCLTGNQINVENYNLNENRWIAKADILRYGVELKKDAKGITTEIAYVEENKLYKAPITYYNVSQLNITKELEQKFVPMKEKTIEKSKDKEIER